MFSEFSTLDAYVSSDYYERRNDSLKSIFLSLCCSNFIHQCFAV